MGIIGDIWVAATQMVSSGLSRPGSLLGWTALLTYFLYPLLMECCWGSQMCVSMRPIWSFLAVLLGGGKAVGCLSSWAVGLPSPLHPLRPALSLLRPPPHTHTTDPCTRLLMGDLNLSLLCLTLGRWVEKARVREFRHFQEGSRPRIGRYCFIFNYTKFSDFILSY